MSLPLGLGASGCNETSYTIAFCLLNTGGVKGGGGGVSLLPLLSYLVPGGSG